jgi:predicted dehydrogenase
MVSKKNNQKNIRRRPYRADHEGGSITLVYWDESKLAKNRNEKNNSFGALNPLTGMKIRFSIIGCGRVAQRHAALIHEIGTLVSVCDIDPARARLLSERYDVPAFFSIEDLLRREPRPDVVAVCTPNGLHAAHTILALEAGCHVICEKPMALTVSECGAMIAAANTAGRKLFIVKQNRFNPPVRAVKKLVDEGRLGVIQSVQLSCFWNRGPAYYRDSWHGTKEMDGGTLFTQFSHFIDLLYWLAGDIADVRGYTANLGHGDSIEFEDTGTFAVKFSNGAIGTINYTVNSHRKNMEGSLTLFGEKGTVKIGGQYLNELEYQEILDFRIDDLPAGNPPNRYGEYEGSMSNHDRVYQNVVDTLNGAGAIATDGSEGLKTVEIISRIYEAARRL